MILTKNCGDMGLSPEFPGESRFVKAPCVQLCMYDRAPQPMGQVVYVLEDAASPQLGSDNSRIQEIG